MCFNQSSRQLYHSIGRRVERTIFSIGNTVECCYCGWSGSRFLSAGQPPQPNRLCPGCGSLQRYRMLHLYLTKHTALLNQSTRLLDIAPKRCFSDFCRRQPTVTYISSDLQTSGASVFSDLTRMAMASQTFDIIICFHVLEHIPDDKAAYTEIGRLLKPGGFALIMVPLKGETTFEDPNAQPEDYERLYGQHDHVRICGMDTAKRIEATGLNVETIDLFGLLDSELMQRHGLYGDDRYMYRVSRKC